jgi:hypothetical protein
VASSTLCLSRGAVEVTRASLATFEAPLSRGNWFPLKHAKVLDTVSTTLQASGYRIARERLAVARDGHRFFGVLDLDSTLAPGVTLAVGVRSSTDKSFPLGFCAGSRAFVCDNLAFRAELLVKRKHTRHGETRFQNAIAGAIGQLQVFREVEGQRIRWLQQRTISEADASHYVLKALSQQIVSAPSVPRIWDEILHPSFDYGGADGVTLWRILQAFTTVLGPRATRSPAEYAGMTMRLNALLCPAEPQFTTPA